MDALPACERVVDALFDSASDALAIVDAEGVIQRASASWEPTFGFAPGDIVGRAWPHFLHPDDRKSPERAVRVACGDGSYARASLHRTPLGDGRAVLVLRKEPTVADESLTRKIERYEEMFYMAPLPMWIFDTTDFMFVDANEAAVRKYGWTRAELVAMSVLDIRLPEDAPSFIERVRREDVSALAPVSERHRKRDGVLIDVETYGHTLKYGGLGWRLVVVEDVSERRRLEEQLRQAQKMDAIGQLAGGVAHDFNNLLAVIQMDADSIAEALPHADASVREDIDSIRNSAERAASLTHQLLAFSRRQVMKPRILDMNAVVRETDKLLCRMIGEDIELVLHLDPNVMPVKADPGQISQVLMNLAVNARDAMAGGGKLTVETFDATLGPELIAGVSDLAPGRYVLVAVTDTGAGMDDATRAKIFEPFFTTKAMGKGTGLGLATVFGIVRQSGGAIFVESTPGKGTTFRMFFPCASAEELTHPPPTSRPTAAPAQQASTILVVEDDAELRRVIVRVLRARGYEVLQAGDVKQAVSIADAHSGPIDLLLTDMVMPGEDGYRGAERVRELRPDVRVLFMTGYTEHPALRANMIDRLITKPFTIGKLVASVHEALEADDAARARGD